VRRRIPLRVAVFLVVLALERRAAADEAVPVATGAAKPLVQQEVGTARALARDSRAAADAYSKMFAVLEMLFPDLRLQTPARIGDGVNALVVAWPVHVLSMVRGSHRSALGASLFVEPQLPTNDVAPRGLVGVRVFGVSGGFGAVLEAGGLLGTDGSGLFAGAGPAIGTPLGMLSAVARRYVVTDADRYDFSIDLTLPLRPLLDVLGR
jgi:hypothetical protein